MDQPRHKQSGRGATLPGDKVRVRKDYGAAVSIGYVERFVAEQLKVEKRHVNKSGIKHFKVLLQPKDGFSCLARISEGFEFKDSGNNILLPLCQDFMIGKSAKGREGHIKGP